MTDKFEWETFEEQKKYLNDRGIDDFTINRLHLEIVTKAKLEDLGFRTEANRGILWSLKDISGKPTGKFGARVFYNKGFRPVEDRPKFLTPKGQIPGLYFSPLARWDRLKYGQSVIICESFLKADIAALLGYHAVGVSGCWGWSHRGELNWGFNTIPWRDQGLKPVLCMDSNVDPEQGHLYMAAAKFRIQMDALHGVEARIILLPPRETEPRDDWGLDDFYVARGKDATVALLDSDPLGIRNEMGMNLTALNDEVVFVKEISRVADIKSGILMSRSQFEDMNYATRKAENEEGKLVPVAKVWTRWNKRREVSRIEYCPGEDRVVDTEYFNLWKGMGCEPRMGDASLFTEWVDTVFLTDVERNFFLDWWSWQLQNLGGKLTTALVMVGKSGIGKGWMTEIAQHIWGPDNIAPVSLYNLSSTFNGDYATKQLMVVVESDQLGGKAGGAIYNKLKDLITSSRVRVERKGMDAFTVENRVNAFLQGNNIDIFRIDEFDRRLAVLEAVDSIGDIRNNPNYWNPRWQWIRSGGGAAVVYGYLLQRDLSGFDPQGEAPQTAAKRDMMEMTHDPLDQWVGDLLLDSDSVMQIAGSVVDGRLHTAKELLFVYLEGKVPMSDISRSDTMKMVKALKNARCPVANGGQKIKGTGNLGNLGNQSQRYFLLSGTDFSENWSQEVADRLFWRRLVASMQGQVASDGGTGNRNSKF